MDVFHMVKESVLHAMNEEPVPCGFQGPIGWLTRAGRSVEGLAHENGPCAATIHGWVRQADIDVGDRPVVLTGQERDIRYCCVN